MKARERRRRQARYAMEVLQAAAEGRPVDYYYVMGPAVSKLWSGRLFQQAIQQTTAWRLLCVNDTSK